MYITGDHVICRTGGVWRVTGVDGDEIRLARHENDARKTVTAGDGEIVRRIVTKEEIEEAVERVPYIRALQAPNAKARVRLYEEAMSKYDESEWIKVIKTVYIRQNIMKSLGEAELAYGERAKDYLHGEVSVLLEMPLPEVEAHIASIVTRG